MMNPYGRSDTPVSGIRHKAHGRTVGRVGNPLIHTGGGQKATAWDVGIRDAKLLEQSLEERKKAGA